MADDLEKLLSDVHKTISENKRFLEKLVDETAEEDSEEETTAISADNDFEEL